VNECQPARAIRPHNLVVTTELAPSHPDTAATPAASMLSLQLVSMLELSQIG
jgi:hypothetical protein